MKIAGIILLVVGVMAFIPLQMLLPFPYGIGIGISIIVVGIVIILQDTKTKKIKSHENSNQVTTKFCVNCGTKLSENSKFCSKCGFSQEISKKEQESKD